MAHFFLYTHPAYLDSSNWTGQEFFRLFFCDHNWTGQFFPGSITGQASRMFSKNRYIWTGQSKQSCPDKQGGCSNEQ